MCVGDEERCYYVYGIWAHVLGSKLPNLNWDNYDIFWCYDCKKTPENPCNFLVQTPLLCICISCMRNILTTCSYQIIFLMTGTSCMLIDMSTHHLPSPHLLWEMYTGRQLHLYSVLPRLDKLEVRSKNCHKYYYYRILLSKIYQYVYMLLTVNPKSWQCLYLAWAAVFHQAFFYTEFDLTSIQGFSL